MSEKAGEVVRVVAEQDDVNGETLSRVTVEWFGNENAEANVMSMNIIEALAGAANNWRMVKQSGESEPKNRGAIR